VIRSDSTVIYGATKIIKANPYHLVII